MTGPRPEVYTTREVADLFGVTPGAVARWVKVGRLQPRRGGGRGRPREFPAEDIHALLEEQTDGLAAGGEAS